METYIFGSSTECFSVTDVWIIRLDSLNLLPDQDVHALIYGVN